MASIALAATILAPSAQAATEFGSNCTGREIEPGFTVIDLTHSSSEPLPVAAPVGGVITRGKISIDSSASFSGLTGTLSVWRPAGPDQFTLVGESSPVPLSPGANTFSTRVPVQAGDHLGYANGTREKEPGFLCRTEDPADVIAYTDEPPSPGGTGSFGKADEFRAPLAAVIEPDSDNDGFGDETQDGCPQSAAVQTPCPVIVLDSSAKAGKKAVVVTIAASSGGSVSVTGVARLGKGKKATLTAAPKTVAAGTTANFRLKFNAKLKKRLRELPPSRKLTLRITASATNLAGQVSLDQSKVKLKGQG